MPPSTTNNIHRFFLLILATMVLLMLPAATIATQTPTPAPADPPDPQEQHANVEPMPDDLQTLKQRYGKDPTGVRARLGMCRRGHGKGHGRGHGAMRGGHHWCPSGDTQENQP